MQSPDPVGFFTPLSTERGVLVSQAQIAPSEVAPPEPELPLREPQGDPSPDESQPPDDRSHLLRRTPRSQFFRPESDDDDGIRLRRQRRAGSRFSGIPGLSRNGRG